jgi:alpha-L-fucosidase
MKTQKAMAITVVSLAVLLAAVLGLSCKAADSPAPQAAPTAAVADPLKQYQCPEWFRDAKFGIWAHWGPQAVPMMGDWYARNMYMEGSNQYKHHLETYGHPSEKGYKDIIPLWKAEKFDPDRLIALYKKAGAKYFVSMGVHHDNFDLWNSTYNKWNAVKMGPQRDILGDWQKAAKKQGLYFGVSEHLGASFTWFQVSRGADKKGPKAGVPYDGNDPKYEDLYHFKAKPGDTGWYSNDPKWHEEWYNRIKDLVDQYKPDLLYTDGGIPFGQTGRTLVGHYYDESAKANGGVVQAVYTCKQKADGQWVEDLERGVKAAILPEPWQTDTSIGDWYYNKNWKFRDVNWTIHMLIDIVSKNGNLLLNVVQRPDGSIDPEVEQMLEKVAAWMAVNGEAIYATRPWLTFGEGAVKAGGGNFKEDFTYSGQDIRYTRSKDGKVLNAFVLGWPGQSVTLRSVQVDAAAPEAKVRMLGYDGKVEYTVNADKQLVITVPDLPENKRPVGPAWTFQLTGFTVSLHPSAQGEQPGAVTLTAEGAALEGEKINTEQKGNLAKNIGFWDSAQDKAHWLVSIKQAGTYMLRGEFAAASGASKVTVEVIPGPSTTAEVPSTGTWDKGSWIDLGKLNFEKPGIYHLVLRAADPAAWKPINVWRIQLTPLAK